MHSEYLVLELQGDHYTMGRQHGHQVRALRPSIKEAIAARFCQIEQDGPDAHFESLFQATREIVRRFAPSLWALLCAGDHLSVAPESALWLTGVYGESLYVRSLLDKIGVEADFMHMGAYKSAAEMLTRTGPSAAAEENVNWLLDSYYDSLVRMIGGSRKMMPKQVRNLIDQGPYTADDTASAVPQHNSILVHIHELTVFFP